MVTIEDDFYEPIIKQMEQDWDDRDQDGQLIGGYKRLNDGRWFFDGVPGWVKHPESSLMELCFQAGLSKGESNRGRTSENQRVDK